MKYVGKVVAIKIGKNSKSDIDNAQIESRFLQKIGSQDPDKHRIIKIVDSLFFRRHYLIVTEVLDINLYEYLKGRNYVGMEKELLRKVATQVLQGLKHLAEIKIIHCDLKPENILFTDSDHQDVKIIDFGSACTEFKNGFTYVQSRFYRAPEVVLGIPYSNPIDMWSFGCIIIELMTGRPIFQVVDERELIEMLRARIGLPPQHMI